MEIADSDGDAKQPPFFLLCGGAGKAAYSRYIKGVSQTAGDLQYVKNAREFDNSLLLRLLNKNMPLTFVHISSSDSFLARPKNMWNGRLCGRRSRWQQGGRIRRNKGVTDPEHR